MELSKNFVKKINIFKNRPNNLNVEQAYCLHIARIFGSHFQTLRAHINEKKLLLNRFQRTKDQNYSGVLRFD